MQIQQRNRVLHPRPELLTLALGLMSFATTLVPNLAHAWGTFVVDPYCAWAYSTIQAAVDAATAYTDDSHADYIWISNDVTYTGQHIIINDDETEIIEGGFTDCNDFDPGTDHTTISGAGNDGGPVFQITGNGGAVVFSNLYITGAQRPGQNGGGIYYAGHGLLQIELTNIYLNEAGYGGGIYVTGSGGEATLYLEHDTSVLNNTADVSGGGIRIEGTTRLFALHPQTWIGFNHAMNGYGGGVEILGPARADIGSAGYNGVGAVSYNDAVEGGGAAAIPSSAGQATLRIFTTDPANPVQIDDNIASGHGGGIYLGAESSNFNHGVLCAYDFRVNDNQGADGAAIYADSSSPTFGDDVGGEAYLNTIPPGIFGGAAHCGPESVPALGAVYCSAGVPCNELRGNQARDSNQVPTAGAVIAVGSGGSLQGDPFSLRESLAAALIKLSGSAEASGVDVVRNCLIADNHTQHELISVQDGRGFGINGCTLAGNPIDNGYAMYVNGSLTLVNSIIDEPGHSVLDYVGDPSNLHIAYVIANEIATLPDGGGVQQNTPVYVDAANGDYHLALHSPGVDYANEQGGTDLERKPRDVNLAVVPNVYGSRDIGAYERQTAFDGCGTTDTLFCNGFGP